MGSTSLLKRNLGIPSAVSHSTMNAVLTNEVTQGTEVIVKKFFFPKGLLGFENVKKYTLTTKSSETPFSRLRMEEGEGYTLLLLPVMGFFPDYNPTFCRDDMASLDIRDPNELLMFNVANFSKGNRPTVNLKGPILFNQKMKLGAQVVIANAADYSTKEVLPL